MQYQGGLLNKSPAHHQYTHVPTKIAPADEWYGCCTDVPEERFVFVGEGNGDYEESMRGNFHYVGPNAGHFDKQRVPPKRTWQRRASVAAILLALLAVTALVAWYLFLAPTPAFDCYAGMENAAAGWSDLKKEYCCEDEGVACSTDGIIVGVSPRLEVEPEWLKAWMGDVSLGIKFTLSATLFAAIGACCGFWSYHQYLVRYATRHRTPTEVEIGIELKKLLRQKGGKTGEVAVTLMWDTIDDLDLHLRLPTGEEISAENPQAGGGKLDVDGNYMLQMGNTKPIENITWPVYDPRVRDAHPPLGEYVVCVKVCARFQMARDINFTVALTVSGETEMFHQKITMCCCEVKVCGFVYYGPPQ